MGAPDDRGLAAVLNAFGIGPDALIGRGGEARVYAIDEVRVVRVLHSGGAAEDIRRRHTLVEELARGRAAFALPEVLEIGEIEGRVYAVERRLDGRSVLDQLRHAEGNARSGLIEAHLDAAAALGDLHLEPRATFGDLIDASPITTATWRGYLVARAAANLARSIPELSSFDAAAVAAGLPEAESRAFVHLDAFTGNMLSDGSRITAVIDIGPTSVVGDRRLDPVAAVVYLASSQITPVATGRDLEVAMSWLRAAQLHDWFDPAQRWLAAYWSFAVDDPNVIEWCRSVLVRKG